MAAKTEARRTGEFILSEANGTRSREQVVVVSGAGKLAAGTVLGKVTASGKYAAYDNAAETGVEVAAGILYAAVDATSADAPAVIVESHAEVSADQLGWGTNDATGKTAGKADLLARGIKIR
jgi:hypothetical protein